MLSVEELKGQNEKKGEDLCSPHNSLIYFLHGLDDPGIKPREVRFSAPPTQAPKPTQPPVEGGAPSFPGVKWPDRGSDHTLLMPGFEYIRPITLPRFCAYTVTP